jgi:hypothetical protein
MNYGFEQVAALATAWLSLLFIAASICGCLCAVGAALAARWFVRRRTGWNPTT